MSMRPKLVRLCKIIGGIPGGLMDKVTEESPEYYALNAVMTDDMCDAASALGVRNYHTLDWIADKTGFSHDRTKEACDALSYAGVFDVWYDEKQGADIYSMGIFAPGILEAMVGNREQLAAHPEIGHAFNEYTNAEGKNLGKMMANGGSLMRVMPIESAVAGLPETLQNERISYFMNKYDKFSVSDCSCRAARRIDGDGCGHLETDMCLHIGPPAEFYARTGKAHYVTRKEAEELLHRAEENGLMHNVPTLEGADELYAICNCCSCSCFALRIGLMYGARDGIRSNFVATIDEAKCVACGQCVETCPANALLLGQKICTKNPLPKEPEYKKMRDSISWSEKDWDKDYRENRRNTVETGTAPCKVACPAHIAVQGYLKLAAQGRYTDALKLIKKENPLPAVCGRICNHVCETECTRGTVDQAVAIDEVKRFIADHDLNEATRYIPPMKNPQGKPYPEKIAIIGSGPAGLSCAYYLAERGYAPTVFEKSSKIGGMLMNGIPAFRLEKDVLNAEIDIIKEMGADFKTGVEVGKDITIPQLREQGYKGFYIAIGAQGGRKVGVPGEDAEGVLAGVDFLRNVNEGNAVSLSGDTVVVGGGNVAVDVARTAVRESTDDASIKMFCLESRDIMPAAADEVQEAEDEGIEVNCGWGPKEILTKDGKVSGIVFKKCTRVFDEQHRFSPEYDEQDTVTIECSNVLLSIGQSIEHGGLFEGTKVEFARGGKVVADPLTYQTAEKDIFAGGDVLTGPRFAIEAIAAGKEAAESLHRIVHEGQTLTMGRNRRVYQEMDKNEVVITDYDHDSRQVPGYNKTLSKSFADAHTTFTEEQVRKETARCLGCGATKVDEYLCIGCGLCTTRCEFDAIKLRKNHNWTSGSYEGVPFRVAQHVVVRTTTAAGKKVAGKIADALTRK